MFEYFDFLIEGCFVCCVGDFKVVVFVIEDVVGNYEEIFFDCCRNKFFVCVLWEFGEGVECFVWLY